MTPPRTSRFGRNSGTLEIYPDEQEDIDALVAEARQEPGIYWKQACTAYRQIIVLKNVSGDVKIIVAKQGLEMWFPETM